VRDIGTLCECPGMGLGKPKPNHLWLNLARHVEDNRTPTGISAAKGRLEINVGLLLNGAGDFVTTDMEKAEVLHAFFAVVSTDETSLWESQAPEMGGAG